MVLGFSGEWGGELAFLLASAAGLLSNRRIMHYGHLSDKSVENELCTTPTSTFP
jgi:hypothetical protein